MDEFDFRGLQCPLPVLKANKALRPLAGGQEVRFLATDAAAPADFRAFCEATGHTLVTCDRQGDDYVIVVRKAGG
jgi:tRNA 2-thiouridine synthesizing protein A